VTVNLDLGQASVGLVGTFVRLEGVYGSPQDDEIIGRSTGSTFNITGPDQGNVDSNFEFYSIEKVIGGSITIRSTSRRTRIRSRSH